MSRVRITASDVAGHDARVVHVADDGTETDISNCVAAVTVHLNPRRCNEATIDIVPAVLDVPVDIKNLIVNDVTPEGL